MKVEVSCNVFLSSLGPILDNPCLQFFWGTPVFKFWWILHFCKCHLLVATMESPTPTVPSPSLRIPLHLLVSPSWVLEFGDHVHSSFKMC